MAHPEIGESKLKTSADFKVTIPEEELVEINKNKEESHNRQIPTLVQSVSKYFSEFMSNSTIHGVKYLVGNERSFIEKLWWFLVLSLSAYTCAVLIGLTWKKWEENPVFIGFAQTPIRMWEIPFPAVTICSQYKFNLKSQYIFKYYDHKIGLNKTGNMSSFCTYLPGVTATFDDKNPEEVTNFVTKTGFSRKNLLSFCNWNSDTDLDCETLFSSIFTEMGRCFSFNMLDRKDLFTPITYFPKNHAKQPNISHWSFDENYAIVNQSGFPYRATVESTCLWVYLNGAIHKRGCYGGNGYKIMLHHPATLPTVSTLSIDIDNTDIYDEYILWIRPDLTIASDNLKSYSPHRRKCLYSNEGQLKFYKIYTLENCKMECIANRTLRRCGCVSYEMPREATTKLCALDNFCPHFVKKFLIHSESGISPLLDNYYKDIQSCDCPSSCNSIIYNADVIKSSNRKILVDNDLKIRMQFRSTEFVALERQELFGDVNFWASCGGVVGLFTGFSVVSLAEMIYYFSLRWICNIGRRFWRWRLM